MGVLGYDRRPGSLAERQACAAVGQSRLMALYESLFRHFDQPVAQVLLTHDDLADHTRHLNARNTLLTLLKHKVLPIINENDVVSVTELKFGDNDRLSALVASLLPADLLVILTTADGLIEHFGKPEARLLETVEAVDARIEAMAGGTSSETATGGMTTKILAAKIVVRSGIPLVIAPGHRHDALEKIVNGESVGTRFLAGSGRLSSRKRWIAFYHHAEGTLTVDAGAVVALRDHGRSLLAPGILRCEESFRRAMWFEFAIRKVENWPGVWPVPRRSRCAPALKSRQRLFIEMILWCSESLAHRTRILCPKPHPDDLPPFDNCSR